MRSVNSLSPKITTNLISLAIQVFRCLFFWFGEFQTCGKCVCPLVEVVTGFAIYKFVQIGDNSR